MFRATNNCFVLLKSGAGAGERQAACCYTESKLRAVWKVNKTVEWNVKLVSFPEKPLSEEHKVSARISNTARIMPVPAFSSVALKLAEEANLYW